MEDENQNQDQTQGVSQDTTQAIVPDAELDALFDQAATGQDTTTTTTNAAESVAGAAGGEGDSGNGAGQDQQGAVDGDQTTGTADGSQASEDGTADPSATDANDANGATASDGQATGAEGSTTQPAQKAAAGKTVAAKSAKKSPVGDNRIRSLEGRLAATMAENERLKKGVNVNPAASSSDGATGSTGATTPGQGAAPVSDKAKALFQSDNWKKMATDYPEIAGPLEEVIGAIGATAANAAAKATSIEATDASKANAKLVMDVHPDAGRLVRDPAFQEWRKMQPSYVQNLIQNNGSSIVDPDGVIDVFNRFKADNGIAAQAQQSSSHGGKGSPSNTNTTTSQVRQVRQQGAVTVSGNKGGPINTLPDDPDKLFDALAAKATSTRAA